MSATTTEKAKIDASQQDLTPPAFGAGEDHYKQWPNEAGFNALHEQLEPVELKVQGSFPPYLAGRLMRTGPGAYKFPRANAKDGYFVSSHWFDGFSHVHKFEIEPQPGGTPRIIYQSRRQADKRLQHARETGKFEGISFGQKRDPCDSFFKKVKSVWEPTHSSIPGHVDIGVAFQSPIHAAAQEGHANRNTLTATSDQSKTLEFDLDTLEPFGVTDQSKMHSELDGQLSAAHPSRDPETGDYFNYNLKLGPKPAYKIFRINARDGSTDVLATVTGIEASYLHSSFLTRNFFILCVWPAYFVMGGAKVLWERNILDAIEKFNPKAQTKWIVVDRHCGRGLVAELNSAAMFCFHTINAWERERDDGRVDIVCELIEYPDLDVLHQFYYTNLVSTGSGAGSIRATESMRLTRYVLPEITLPSKSVPAHKRRGSSSSNDVKKSTGTAELIIRTTGGDLPTINQAHLLKQHRYVYGACDRGYSSFMDGLVKTDTETGKCTYWSVNGHTPGEAIFIRNPDGEQEDDGVLLSCVLDGHKGTSYLLALAAQTMEEVGRAEVPCAINLGFHGYFLA